MIWFTKSNLAELRALRAEVIELRHLIQQANSDHARERDKLHNDLVALGKVVASRTEHLA